MTMKRPQHPDALTATAIALALLLAQPTTAQDSAPTSKDWLCYPSKAALLDAAIQFGEVRINNISLHEGASLLLPGANKYPLANSIFFQYALTNRGARNAFADVQLAGFDESDRLLFVAEAPSRKFNGRPGTTSNVEGRAFLEEGLLARIAQFCVLARAAEASPPK
jgi:hypothetical protein